MALTNRQINRKTILEKRAKEGTLTAKGAANLAKLSDYQSGKKTNPAAAKLTNKINPKKPGTAVAAETQFANQTAENAIRYQNPNQINPFGSQTTTIDPETGQPTVSQTLSPEEQRIYQGGAQLSGYGRELAASRLQSGGFDQAFNPQLNERWSSGQLEADRARIEEEVFGRLTKNLERDQALAMQQAETTLQERGIPYSGDPNSRYQQELRAVNERFDAQKTDARQRAAEIGGQEYSRNFGIGEQLRTNQLGEQQGIRNQNIGEIGTFGQLGPGQTLPQFQGFQAPNYAPQSPLSAYGILQGIQLNKDQLASQNAYQQGVLKNQAASIAKQGNQSSGVQPPVADDPNLN